MSRQTRWDKRVNHIWFGKCPCCGGKPEGGRHHIIPRENLRTKYIVINGILTCWNLHRAFEDPEKEEQLAIKYIGEYNYNELKKIAMGYRENNGEFEEII